MTADASMPHAKGTAGSSEKDAALKDAGARTVTLSGTLTDFKAKTPIAGGSLCLTMPAREPPLCATTDAQGAYSLSIPPDVDVAVAVKADGFFDELVLEHSSVDVHLDLQPVTTTALMAHAAAAGVTLDDTKGILALNIPLPDVTFSVQPASGKLVYYDSNGEPSPSATKTAVPGLAVVFDMEPGAYEATYDTAGKACIVTLGWDGSSANKVRAEVAANSITSVGMGCL